MNEVFQNIGRTISHQREQKGLSIKELSERTKIFEKFIEQIERGHFDFLPDVYIRAFLRTITKEIGLNPEAIIQQYQSTKEPIPDRETEEGSNEPESDDRKSVYPYIDSSDTMPFNLNLSWLKHPYFWAVIIIIIFAVLFFRATNPEEDSEHVPVLRPAIIEDQRPAAEPLKPETFLEKDDAERQIQSDMTLTVRADDNAWIRIVFQDSLADEGLFAPGDVRSWKSTKPFYLIVGNAGGIRLLLNGAEIGPVGNPGQVVNISVDRQGISRISAADFPPAMRASLNTQDTLR